jgi:predicted 3-demethylubiquinone-9 3-methyltransferase (glyoxalase superfamily)
MLKGSKIKPFLWFEDQAEDAARFYTSVVVGLHYAKE